MTLNIDDAARHVGGFGIGRVRAIEPTRIALDYGEDSWRWYAPEQVEFLHKVKRWAGDAPDKFCGTCGINEFYHDLPRYASRCDTPYLTSARQSVEST